MNKVRFELNFCQYVNCIIKGNLIDFEIEKIVLLMFKV
jgi:hypothetical protein